MIPTVDSGAKVPPDHDGNALADMLGPDPLCCGGGGHDGHAGWCAWGRISAPVPVLDEAVGVELHDGRYTRARPCPYCHVPAGDQCIVTPLAGPVVDLSEPRPVTQAGLAAGWGGAP